MSRRLARFVHLNVDRRGTTGRREFLQAIAGAGAVGAAACCGWTERLRLQADELKRQGRACILLWMQGGPSQFETFDPKPGQPTGGETKAISTNVAGIELADNLPRLAQVANRLAVIRSLTSKEGNHQRATALMQSSYLPSASVAYPVLGSVTAHELADAAAELPAFVRIGRGNGLRGGGFLGAAYDPFVVADPSRPPENAQPATDVARYRRRLELRGMLDAAAATTSGLAADQQALYDKAARMVLSPAMQAFEVAEEPEASRQAYGQSAFATGCVLARRLVETGVPFVEVVHPGWDTHQDNFNQSRRLCGEIDQPFAALLTDLADRGLLDRTLVAWMGEFGRTPQINPAAGRGHFPRAFSVALAGCGVRGGQTIGKTSADGSDVAERPVTTVDLFRTIYKALGVDADKKFMSPIGRPIPIVDGGQPVDEALA